MKKISPWAIAEIIIICILAIVAIKKKANEENSDSSASEVVSTELIHIDKEQ